MGSILTINGGSSSVKFALFDRGEPPKRMLSGQIERVADAGSAVKAVAEKLRGHGDVGAIGHRIVFGGIKLLEHQRITSDVLAELKRMQGIDLAHLPGEIALIEAFEKILPGVEQYACFDTAFFRHMPRMGQLLPIPRELSEAGIRKFGFHGLSYTYLMSRLSEAPTIPSPCTQGEGQGGGSLGRSTFDPHPSPPPGYMERGKEGVTSIAASGRVILAHLGNGASMAAVMNGRAMDTTMSFTPVAGLMMGTRPGDLDPGLLVYLMREKNMSADELEEFLTKKCGLLGVSQTSADMRDLMAKRATDVRAAEAVQLFCYQARKCAAALASTMGGVETLVFSGGIGEHSHEVREGICGGLGFLGVELDAALNVAGKDMISGSKSRVEVRVIPTDEESVIAKIVAELQGSTRRA